MTYQQNTGFAYGMTTHKANMTQPLTPDQVAVLKQDNNEVNMKLDQKDLWRAMCTHKDPTTGSSTLIQNPDGSLTCSICGETFNFFEGSEADVAAAVKTLTDMLLDKYDVDEKTAAQDAAELASKWIEAGIVEE